MRLIVLHHQNLFQMLNHQSFQIVLVHLSNQQMKMKYNDTVFCDNDVSEIGNLSIDEGLFSENQCYEICSTTPLQVSNLPPW